MSTSNSVRSRASYGVDAPNVLWGLSLGVPGFLLLAWVFTLFDGLAFVVYWWLAWAAVQAVLVTSYLFTTLLGKFRSWSTVLDELGLRGDERVLDLGCGRGMVLIAVARRLATGTSIGVDLWRGADQSGNNEQATLDNARAEGVADRIELCTADMTALPQTDGEVDLVVSSLAIHNVPNEAGRDLVIDEAIRVLRSGGRVAIADFQHTARYAERLTELGMIEVERRSMGWRFWYSGPWFATRLVTARKP